MKTKKDTFGIVRVGTAVPRIKVADPRYNADGIIAILGRARQEELDVLVFPELSLTGYTCADLFHQKALQEGALRELTRIVLATRDMRSVVLVGLPIAVDDKLFNCAAVIHRGTILGIVPKTFIPGYKEFYEPRWFSSAAANTRKWLRIDGKKVPFGTDLLFAARDFPGLVFGVEICEDVWVPIPPSVFQALAGSVLGLNLSASNERIGKAPYRRSLVSAHSARIMGSYAYVSCGTSESTTDVVFSGHSLICDNGGIVAENRRFEREDVLLVATVDIDRHHHDRTLTNSWAEQQRQMAPMLNFRRVHFDLGASLAEKRQPYVEAHPFVPQGEAQLRARCEEIDNIQVAGLCQRLVTAGVTKPTIGVSGGLDSTRALQVACISFDQLGMPRSNIQGYTMPGFGTSERSKRNAHALMKHLGVTAHEVDIRMMCFEQWLAEGYKPFGIDLHEIRRSVRQKHLEALRAKLEAGTLELTAEEFDVDLNVLALAEFEERLKDLPADAQDLHFENTQARMRTKILMDNGFVIGTGDLSELALGWCTYNGDHMSMYNVNCSVPKTLIKFLVRWSALNQFAGEVRATLLDIFGMPISPELLPRSRDGRVQQKTEQAVGPYELVDFFIYHMLRYGMGPDKILYLASKAKFDDEYTAAEIRGWLRKFYNRFFTAQFKRSCVPDGPKVGSISLSPRGDWRMPSDASRDLWLGRLDEIEANEKECNLMSTEATTGATTPAAATAGNTEAATTAAPEVRRALTIVDAIKAFASKEFTEKPGELPVPEGEAVGPVIGELQDSDVYEVQVAGNDDHTDQQFNFKDVAGDVETALDADGKPWPVFDRHAVHGTWGTEFLPGVRTDKIDRIFPKANQPRVESFSACGNPDLIPYLKEKGITHVDVVGLVFRICVGSTAIDLAKAGFKVRVVVDATRDLPIEAFQSVLDEMDQLGVEIVTSAEVLGKSA